MRVVATSLAASRRLGLTSVAVMLWETSMAMMTVPAERGVGTSTVGPAIARASTARPPKDSHRPAGTGGGADLPRTPAEGDPHPPSTGDDGAHDQRPDRGAPAEAATGW